ncbi:branched-chain amino acid ABC transporter permease [Thermodesulfobacteriota bacterium]
MQPEVIFQGIINGLGIGWIYVLMALGLSLIFSILNIAQLAHGELYMLGAYLAYYFAVTLGVNLILTAFICMIIMAGLGIFLERFLFRPVSKGPFLAPIVISLGLTLILQGSVVEVFGVFPRTIPRLAQGAIRLAGYAIPKDRLVAISVGVILVAFLYLFLKKSKYGMAIVACAQDMDSARLQGVSADKVSSLVMAGGCTLAAVAGVLAGALFTVSPSMGFTPMLKGLIIIVIGGLGSLPGAIIGGLLLGLIDGLVPIILNPAAASVMPLIIVIIIILLRPRGLFGHE